jgi:hypothetical protein
MVCYSSMSPLPSSASMLCSASASFCFYALLFFLLATHTLSVHFSSTFYALCIHCIPLCCTSSLLLFCCLLPPSTLMHQFPKSTFSACLYHAKSSARSSWQLFVTTALCCISILYILFYVLHVIFLPSSLPGPHRNSATLLVVTHCLFIISAHYPEIPFLH